MRLLIIAPYPPTPPLAGGRRRIWEQLRFLSERHELDLACLTYSDVDDDCLRTMRIANIAVFPVRHRMLNTRRAYSTRSNFVTPFWNDELMERIAFLIGFRGYDWVIAEHCYSAAYLKEVGTRKMLTEHNIEYQLFEQLAGEDESLLKAFILAGKPGEMFRDAGKQAVHLKRFEQDVWGRMDLCVAVSDADRKTIAEVASNRLLYTIRNCPCMEIRAKPVNLRPANIVFIGALNYLPNVDAIVQLVEVILPFIRRKHPNIGAIVAGRDPDPRLIEYCSNAGIRVVANPTAFEDVLTSDSVMVCPLRFGAGTRIKILDAMAAEIPVVATAVAVQGLELTAGREFLLASSLDEFGDKVSHLLVSRSLRSRLVRGGSQFLRDRNLRWPAVFSELESHLEAAL